MVKKALFLAFFTSLLLIPLTGETAQKHQTTPGSQSPEISRSAPALHVLSPMWLYSKKDENDQPQIYVQSHIDLATDEPLTEYPLTHSGEGHEHIKDRTQPAWGPVDFISFFLMQNFYQPETGVTPLSCPNPYTFFYLGTDTNTGKRNLYLGCFDMQSDDFMVSYFDVPLTNIDATRSFENIANYHVDPFPLVSLTEPASQDIDLNLDGTVDIPAGGTINHFPIIVLTTSGVLNYITFSPLSLAGDHIDSNFLKYNEQTLGGASSWPTNGTTFSFVRINEAKFADALASIIFIAEDINAQTQIGILKSDGTEVMQITNTVGYRFSDLQTNISLYVPLPMLVFQAEEQETRKAQVMAMIVGALHNGTTTFQWYDEIMALTPETDFNRRHPTFGFGGLYYSREQDDFNHDIYHYPFGTADPSNPDGNFTYMIIFLDYLMNNTGATTLPVTTVSPFQNPWEHAITFPGPPPETQTFSVSFVENRKTCSGNNIDPGFMPYEERHSADHTLEIEPYPIDLMIREINYAGDTNLVHLYELDGSVVCEDTCTENADRSPMLDQDEDGLHDERLDPLTGEKCDFSICGNGVTEDGETCDDANFIDRDGCNATCKIEPLPPIEPEPIPPIPPVLQEDPPLVGGFLFLGSSCTLSPNAKTNPALLGLISIYVFFFVATLFFFRKKVTK